jgi:HK97 family phage major capsid protein
VTLLDDLRTKRGTAREAAETILTRSAESGDPLSAEDAAAHARAVADATEAGDAIETYLAEQVAELRANVARAPGGAAPLGDVLTREQSVTDWCRQRGMSGYDEPLSLGRWLRGIATGEWDGAEHERAMSIGTATAGGHLVPSPLSARVIDLARNATRVMQAGAVTVPMTASTLKLARLTGEGTPGWKTENAAITANADLAFDAVTFTARTLTRIITLSLELAEDADPSSDAVIANSFAAQIASELDRAALRGSGTPPEPKGVLNQSGVTLTTHGAAGALIAVATAYDWHLSAAGLVRAANFTPNAHIQAPRTTTSLSKLREATTSAYLAPPPSMLPMLVTSAVPINLTVTTSTDCSEIYTGQWDQLLIGIRTDLRLLPLRERYIADNLQYAFLAYLRADVQLAQPAAFTVDTGIRS